MPFDNAEKIWERPLTRRQLMAAVVAGGASMALVGCGDDDDDDSGEAQTSTEPKRGGSLTLATFGGPVLVDIQRTHNVGLANDWRGLAAVPLVRTDWKNGTFYDGSAEKWEFPDPTTLIFQLKKNTHFQQESPARGREVEASDVVASLERARTPEPSSRVPSRFNLVTTMEAVDKYTVRIKFKAPDANFLAWMSNANVGSPIPKETLEKYGANMVVPETWYSNGPFVPDFSTFKDAISITMKRNPSYDVDPGGLPYLDAITCIGITDASTREAAVRTGQADIGVLPTLSVKSFENSHQIGSTEDLVTAMSQLDFNTTIPPFNDPRVRQAFHRVVDREELRLVVGDGFAGTAMILGSRSALYLSEKDFDGKPGFRKDKKLDIEEAKKLLAAAGIDPTKTTIKFGASPNTTFKVYADQNASLRGQFERNLGVKIEQIPGGTGAAPSPEQVKTQGIQMTANSQGGLGGIVLDDPLWIAVHSTGLSNANFWNKVDAQIEKQQQLLDLNERKKAWHDLQRQVLDTSDNSQTVPFAPIVRNYDFFGAKNNIKNWSPSGYFVSHHTWQFNKIWIDA